MIKFFYALIAATISAATLERGYIVHRRPQDIIWPIKSRCPLCNKRVWTWQPHERRDTYISLNKQGNRMVRSSQTAVVHRKCTGVPSIVLGAHADQILCNILPKESENHG